MRVGLVLASVLVTMSSCRERPPHAGVVAPTAAAPRKAIAKAADLSPLAPRLDPGEQQPLSQGLPAWADDALGMHTNDVVAIAITDVTAQWTAWTKRLEIDERNRIWLVLELVRSATGLERALGKATGPERVDALFALAPVYAAFDVPPSAIDGTAFTRSMDALFERLRGAQPGVDPEVARRSAEVWAFATAAMLRADAVHRRVLAELVRTAPDDPRLPDALVRGAASIGARDSELAIALARAALERRGDAAKPEDSLVLAQVCFGGLDWQCGFEAVERAWRAGGADDPAFAASIEAAVLDGRRAQRLSGLVPDDSVVGGLERARLSAELGRFADAIRIYTELATRWPADARPAVGLAEILLARTLDFAAASAVLAAVSRPPVEADRRFWELAVGTRAKALSPIAHAKVAKDGLPATLVALAPEIDALATDIRALEATGADTGAVLGYLADRGRASVKDLVASEPKAIHARARRVLPDAIAIEARFPESLLAQQLLLAGTTFSTDRNATFAALQDLPAFLRPVQPVAGLAPVVGAVHPGQTAALRVQWMRASLDATIVWNDVDRADALQGRIADGEMTAEMQIVFTDLMAVAARLHDRNEDWPGVAATYSDQMHMTTGERQARMLHNAGVAFIMAGQLAEGENLLRQAMTIDASAADLARINLFAAGIDGIDLAPLVTSEHPQTRMLALGLAITAARGAAERKRLEAEFRTARARQCRESVHARVLPGPAGIVLRGSVRVDLGMSTADGLQLQLDTTSEPWLLVSSAYAAPLAHPCPTDRASARRATTRPRGAGRDSHP